MAYHTALAGSMQPRPFCGPWWPWSRRATLGIATIAGPCAELAQPLSLAPQGIAANLLFSLWFSIDKFLIKHKLIV